MYDVLMYVFDVDVYRQVTNASFEFKSPGYFSENSNGVSKLSLYLDKNLNGVLDSTDVFLSSTSSFSSASLATISNVSLPQGTGQKLLLLFDLGQRVNQDDDALSIQLSNISMDGGVVAGMVPNPSTPYTYDVEPHLLKVTSLSSDISDSNVITQDSVFDVTTVITAESTESPVKISADAGAPVGGPKFYLDGVKGKDRSYEFSSTFKSGVGSGIGFIDPFISPATKQLVFQVSASNITSEGNYLIDYDVDYVVQDTDCAGKCYLEHPSRLTRSKGAGTNFQSAVSFSGTTGTKITPSISTTNKVYSWTLPGYVSSAQIQVNNQFMPFKNYQSVPQNAELKLTFANKGHDVDPSSIQVQLNGQLLPAESQISSGSSDNYFSYDVTKGELIIQSIGQSSGQVTIMANDLFGQAYPQAPIVFFTSSELQIEKLLVYPNPYSPSIQTDGLTIGFSLTQPASVSFKIFDSTGREVTRLDSEPFDLDYQIKKWPAKLLSNGKFISAGNYYIKMTAVGNDGKRVVSTTKLAVY